MKNPKIINHEFILYSKHKSDEYQIISSGEVDEDILKMNMEAAQSQFGDPIMQFKSPIYGDAFDIIGSEYSLGFKL